MPVRFDGPNNECPPVRRSRRHRLSASLALLWALGLPISTMAQPETPPGEPLRDQFVYDFRGRPLPAKLQPFGPQADELIKPEAEGLRMTLPKDRASVKPVGLSLPLAVGGDFEVTAAFEILQAEEPPPGKQSYGVGVLVSVNQSARVGRLARAKGKQVVTWDHWATVDGERKFLLGAVPSEGQRGRLRLKREMTTLHFLWSPDLAGDTFKEIHQSEFDAPEITQLWFELNTDWSGGQNGALDVRLLELQVRASRPVAPVIAAAEEEPKTEPSKWLRPAVMVALAILLVLAVVLVVVYRRRGAAASVAFACDNCGKQLKSKVELAGKKVKCPQCGSVAVVPRA